MELVEGVCLAGVTESRAFVSSDIQYDQTGTRVGILKTQINGRLLHATSMKTRMLKITVSARRDFLPPPSDSI